MTKKKQVINPSFLDKKTQPVIDILKRVVASGFIKNAHPISAIIIAPVGAGKTFALQKMSINKNIMALSDVTPYGLTRLFNEIRMKGVKHIIIYDLVEPMSRGRAIVNNLIGFLNSLIEEGIFKIQTGFMEVKEPIKLGLITATTSTEITDKRRGWLSIGFISRLLPVSFNYSHSDVIQILDDLAKQQIRGITYEDLIVKEKEIKVNPEIFSKLIPYANQMKQDNALPFRQLEQLKILLMANALLRGDNKVTEDDFTWFKSIVNYLNYDLNNL